jgi:hypothetical protein
MDIQGQLKIPDPLFLIKLNVEKRRPGFQPGSGYMGFVVDKVVLGQVFS